MTLLPLWVDRDGWGAPVSANALVEADVLAEQVHNADARDTARFLMMFVRSLADERERWQDARRRADHVAEAEAAGEMRDLTVLAGVCRDHLAAFRH